MAVNSKHGCWHQWFSLLSSFLFLGFVLKYPEPPRSLPALQVSVCLLTRFAPPVPESGQVARIQVVRRNFGTSLVNLWRALANAGKHICLFNTVQSIKVPFTMWRVYLWKITECFHESSALSAGGASLHSLKKKLKYSYGSAVRCLWVTVCPSLGPSDQAFKNVVVIIRVWPQCCEMNGGLLVGCAGNRVMCVPSPKFRVYVTCKSQIDWLVCGGEGKRVVYLPTDVILWLAWGFYTSALYRAHTNSHTRVWAQTDVAADLRRGPYELNFLPKTTRNNSKICMLTYTDRKEINKKTNEEEPERRDERTLPERAGGWNLAHLFLWRGSQSRAMLWSLNDGQSATVYVVSTHFFTHECKMGTEWGFSRMFHSV